MNHERSFRRKIDDGTSVGRSTGGMLEDRGYAITLNPKRVRSRAFEWDFRHLDWFGADDPRCGCCESVDEATELID